MYTCTVGRTPQLNHKMFVDGPSAKFYSLKILCQSTQPDRIAHYHLVDNKVFSTKSNFNYFSPSKISKCVCVQEYKERKRVLNAVYAMCSMCSETHAPNFKY